jgi:hypothetical protein
MFIIARAHEILAHCLPGIPPRPACGYTPCKLIAREEAMTVHTLRDEEVQLLRKEIEMLMGERQRLLQVVGAAAVLVANLDSDTLPDDEDTIDAAEMLAEQLNDLSEETLKDALDSVRAEMDERPQA